jgi:chromosome partitioning protein
MIICVASLKGGIGKTTTAIHLAAFLHQHANTLLMDIAPNRSAMGWAARGSLPFDVVDEWQTLGEAEYSHVVIDTQPRPIASELEVLVQSSDLLILPTSLDIMSLDALALLLEQLQAITPPPERYRILLTLLPKRLGRDVDRVRAVLESANQPVFGGGIRSFAAFAKAAQAGCLVTAVNDNKALEAWQDYQAVGQEMLSDFGIFL